MKKRISFLLSAVALIVGASVATVRADDSCGKATAPSAPKVEIPSNASGTEPKAGLSLQQCMSFCKAPRQCTWIGTNSYICR